MPPNQRQVWVPTERRRGGGRQGRSCRAPQEYAESREKQPHLPAPDSSSGPQAPCCLDETPQASLAGVCPALPSGSPAVGSSSFFPLWNCHRWRHSDIRWNTGWHPCLRFVQMNMTMNTPIINPPTQELKLQVSMPPAWERVLYSLWTCFQTGSQESREMVCLGVSVD